MKKLHYVLTSLFICAVSQAGLITHTDYTAGNVITAAGQNTNENAVFNEFNGNISAANLASDSVTSAKILDGTILKADLNSTLQSTFTQVSNTLTYRRPVLQWISITTIDVEANTGVANQTCVIFPLDGQRCVTENTSSTSVNRRFIITEAASNSGTKNSGLIGANEASNTWYALYAWEVSDNSTDFVIVGTTVIPVQANYSTLNGMFGTGTWVYLGEMHNGDLGSTASDILSFTQAGNVTKLSNSSTGANVADSNGMISSTTASSPTAGIAVQYAAGTSGYAYPAHLTLGYWAFMSSKGTAHTLEVAQSGGGGSFRVFYQTSVPGTLGTTLGLFPMNSGLSVTTNNSASTIDIFLQGWVDGALGVGYNPQM